MEYLLNNHGYVFFLPYLFYFSWVATKYNTLHSKAKNIKMIMLNKSAKKDKIKKRIAELNKAAAKYKPITYIVYGVFFVLHLLGLLAFGIFDNSNFLIAFALFAVFIVFAIILFWLKGASIIPPVEFEESDYDF